MKSRKTSSCIHTIRVRSGRHVDGLSFHFPNGIENTHGNFNSGERTQTFTLHVKKLEYIVRILVREGEHLDGIQFITNYGRVSPWMGGGGGKHREFTAPQGQMIVNLAMEEAAFCSKIRSLVTSTAPSLKPASLKWLISNKSTRKLIFSGKPSIYKLSKKGKPSIFSLLFSGKPRLFSLMMKGDRVENPSILRLFLTGEQNELSRFSLLRLLCDKRSYLRISERNALQILFESGNEKPGLIRYLFYSSRSDSIMRLMTLNGQNRLFLQNDYIRGYPSLLKLLLLPQIEGEKYIFPSIMELITYQEQSNIDKESILRLMLKEHQRKESIFNLLLEGRNSRGEEGDMRSIIQLSLEPDIKGISLLRRLITPNHGYIGYSPSIFNFALKGEENNENSIFRLLLEGEEKEDRNSIFRILSMIYKPKDKGENNNNSLLDMLSSFNNQKRDSILQLMMNGNPSIMDLLFEEELTSDHSLARLLLGFNISVINNQLKIDIDYSNKRRNDSLGFMKFLLIGEEKGGPGISLLRLLLHGEETNGLSVLRLLIMNESKDLPSLMRIALVAQKAFLLGLKQRKSDTSQWKENLRQMKELIVKSHKKSLGETMNTFFKTVVSSVQKGISKYKEIIEILKTIPARGKEFEEMWKASFLSVANELEKIEERVDDEDSPWRKLCPLLSILFRELAHQNWVKAFEASQPVIAALALVVEQYTEV